MLEWFGSLQWPPESKGILTRQLFTVTTVRYLVDVTATARLAHSLAYPLLYSSNKRIHTWSHIECAPQSSYCSVSYPLLSPTSFARVPARCT